MLFPYLEMVHSCVPSDLVNDAYLELWSISFLKHFLQQWQAQVHPSSLSTELSALRSRQRKSTSPFSLTYYHPAWKLNGDTSNSPKLASPPKKRQWAYFIIWFNCFLLKLQSQALVEIAIPFELAINLSFLPLLNWKRKSSYYHLVGCG